MAKETYYFQHDYNPTSDPKIEGLISEHGLAAYGLYWRLVEMLHQDDEHRLPLKKYLFVASAKQMLSKPEQVLDLVNYMIETLELFASDGDYFWSERVLRNMQKREEIKQIRSKAGRKGGIAKNTPSDELDFAKQTQANAKQSEAKTSKGKERKGKEIYKETNNTHARGEFDQNHSFQEAPPQPVPVPPPEKQEFMNYCTTHGFHPQYAEHLFDQQESTGWLDPQGRSIHKWTAYANKSFKYQDKFLKSIAQNDTAKASNGKIKSQYETRGDRAARIFKEAVTDTSGF